MTNTPAPTPQTFEQKYARLDAFIGKLQTEVYPELPSEIHEKITALAWQAFNKLYPQSRGAKVLDIGCGQGVALKHFAADGLDAVGIALGEDVGICRQAGYNVLEMDLSFLEFADGSFDLVWCRHVLEHSVFPYFTLAEIARVMKPGAVAYIEVPAPDTVSNHQNNPNHYSVLGRSMWVELMRRSGFRSVKFSEINFELKIGMDTYWSFIIQK